MSERLTVDDLRRGIPPGGRPHAGTRVLGLDPAALLGFAHSDGYRGTVDLKIGLGRPHEGEQLLRLLRWLRKTLQEHPTDLISSEDAGFGSHNPSIQAIHNEKRGIIKAVACEFNIDLVFFKPNSIKLFATGDGDADKHKMIRYCRNLYGIEPSDDNECDAIFAMEFAKQPAQWPEKTKSKSKPKQPRKPRSKKLFE